MKTEKTNKIIVYIICKTERPHFLKIMCVCVTTQKWIQDQNVVWFFWNRWEIESDWVTILIVLSKMCTCVNTNSLNEEPAYIKICTVFCHWLCPLLPPHCLDVFPHHSFCILSVRFCCLQSTVIRITKLHQRNTWRNILYEMIKCVSSNCGYKFHFFF